MTDENPFSGSDAPIPKGEQRPFFTSLWVLVVPTPIVIGFALLIAQPFEHQLNRLGMFGSVGLIAAYALTTQLSLAIKLERFLRRRKRSKELEQERNSPNK